MFPVIVWLFWWVPVFSAVVVLDSLLTRHGAGLSDLLFGAALPDEPELEQPELEAYARTLDDIEALPTLNKVAR